MFRIVSQRWDDCPAWSCQETPSHLSDDILQVIHHYHHHDSDGDGEYDNYTNVHYDAWDEDIL